MTIWGGGIDSTSWYSSEFADEKESVESSELSEIMDPWSERDEDEDVEFEFLRDS